MRLGPLDRAARATPNPRAHGSLNFGLGWEAILQVRRER